VPNNKHKNFGMPSARRLKRYLIKPKVAQIHQPVFNDKQKKSTDVKKKKKNSKKNQTLLLNRAVYDIKKKKTINAIESLLIRFFNYQLASQETSPTNQPAVVGVYTSVRRNIM
jgi:hypothetical protein